MTWLATIRCRRAAQEIGDIREILEPGLGLARLNG
jgi:hypothetical protein